MFQPVSVFRHQTGKNGISLSTLKAYVVENLQSSGRGIEILVLAGPTATQLKRPPVYP